MSGFVAILHTTGAPVDPVALGELTDAIAYCGPDGRGTWAEDGIGLGHVLLSHAPEVMTEAERQPASRDGRIRIVADARIDGREELVSALRGHGRDVEPAAADAQLILHAYAAWGERCVEHLIGDFAFALWDEPQRRLFCARDQFGAVPLYYARVPEGLAVSNVLNCLRRHPSVSNALNERAIGDFLLFKVNRDLATTSFADIEALPPAHVLTAEAGATRTRRYWELPAERDRVREGRPEDHVERFTAAFDRAVADRLRSRRVGTQLSGGMDSTSIAATAQRVLAGRGGEFDLRAYTIVYGDLIDEDEGSYADQVAATLGIPVEHLLADEYLARPPEGDVDWVFPEPCVIPNRLPEHEIAARVSAFARGLLVGFGGDPLFAFRPTGIRRRLRAKVARLRPRNRRIPPLPDWIDPAFARRADLASRWREAVRAPRPGLDGMADPLWVALFSWGHPGAKGSPVRAHFPFFDVRLVDAMARTPPVPWCQDKRLLREAMRGRLPEAVLSRPKTPLWAPTNRSDTSNPAYRVALAPETKRWRRDLLSRSPIGDYVCMERALAEIESPTPERTLPDFRNCFVLAHWLRSPGGVRPIAKGGVT